MWLTNFLSGANLTPGISATPLDTGHLDYGFDFLNGSESGYGYEFGYGYGYGYSTTATANLSYDVNITDENLGGGQYNISAYVYTGKPEVKEAFISLESTFTVDDQAPTVLINSPENKTYSSRTRVINATVTDATTSVDTVIAEINGSINVTLKRDGSSKYYNTSYTFSEGVNSVRIYANDTVGNMNSTEMIYFTISVPQPVTPIPPGIYKPRAVVLANNIDFNLSSEFFGYLENQGIDVLRVTASDFNDYKTSKFIVILGGPDAYEGVGEVVQEMLDDSEEAFLRTPGNRKMYVKTNVWRRGQVVRIIAGSGRDQTRAEAVEKQADVAYRIKYHPVS
jgi:hypothetical protein